MDHIHKLRNAGSGPPYFSPTYEAVVEACVKNSTHYVDITGEVPWMHLGRTIDMPLVFVRRSVTWRVLDRSMDQW